jgi:hypothetical protein
MPRDEFDYSRDLGKPFGNVVLAGPIAPSLMAHVMSIPHCPQCRRRLTEGTEIRRDRSIRYVRSCDSCGYEEER